MFPISGINASNSAFNVMNLNQNAMASASSASPESSTNALANAGKQNALSQIQNTTQYKIGDVLFDSEKSLKDKNIKRTFSYMA